MHAVRVYFDLLMIKKMGQIGLISILPWTNSYFDSFLLWTIFSVKKLGYSASVYDDENKRIERDKSMKQSSELAIEREDFAVRWVVLRLPGCNNSWMIGFFHFEWRGTLVRCFLSELLGIK